MKEYTEAFLAAAAAEAGLGAPPAGCSDAACYRIMERHDLGVERLNETDERIKHGRGVAEGVLRLHKRLDEAQAAAWRVFLEKQQAAARLPNPEAAAAPEAYNLASHTVGEAMREFSRNFRVARLLSFYATGNPDQFIGWRTDARNRAGTAHLYLDTSASPNGSSVRSICGRVVLVSDLQAEITSMQRCKRCSQ